MIRAALLRIATRRPPDFIVGDNPADPYLQRWHVIPRNDWLNIYLHQFLHSDDDRALHTHPYRWNVSWLLHGRYLEWVPFNKRKHVARAMASDVGLPGTVRSVGDIVFRWGASPHRIELHRGPCWTLFITGRRVREWGFICPQGWRHWSVFTKRDAPGQIGRGCE